MAGVLFRILTNRWAANKPGLARKLLANLDQAPHSCAWLVGVFIVLPIDADDDHYDDDDDDRDHDVFVHDSDKNNHDGVNWTVLAVGYSDLIQIYQIIIALKRRTPCLGPPIKTKRD